MVTVTRGWHQASESPAGSRAHTDLSNPAEKDAFSYRTTGGKALKCVVGLFFLLFFLYCLFALIFSNVLFQFHQNLKK